MTATGSGGETIAATSRASNHDRPMPQERETATMSKESTSPGIASKTMGSQSASSLSISAFQAPSKRSAGINTYKTRLGSICTFGRNGKSPTMQPTITSNRVYGTRRRRESSATIKVTMSKRMRKRTWSTRLDVLVPLLKRLDRTIVLTVLMCLHSFENRKLHNYGRYDTVDS